MTAIIGFITSYWRIILPGIAGLLLVVFVLDKVSDMKEAEYKKGVEATNSQWNKRVAEEEAKNKEFETKLQQIVNNFGKETVEKTAERVKESVVYKDRISTIVKQDTKYQECQVDEEVLKARNTIRAKGPSGVKLVAPTTEGTIRVELP